MFDFDEFVKEYELREEYDERELVVPSEKSLDDLKEEKKEQKLIRKIMKLEK